MTPFTCPKCGCEDTEFPNVCPECGSPFFRDYADTQMHPRDPGPTGSCTVKFRARVLLALTAGGIIPGLLSSFRLL